MKKVIYRNVRDSNKSFKVNENLPRDCTAYVYNESLFEVHRQTWDHKGYQSSNQQIPDAFQIRNHRKTSPSYITSYLYFCMFKSGSSTRTNIDYVYNKTYRCIIFNHTITPALLHIFLQVIMISKLNGTRLQWRHSSAYQNGHSILIVWLRFGTCFWVHECQCHM